MTARKAPPPVKPAPRKKPGAVAKTPVTKVKAVVPSNKVAAAVAKEDKPKKVKLIRDSFTMPAFDFDLIDALKAKALNGKAAVKKSELLRAGLHALSKLDSKQLIALVGTLTLVKTGRPKK